MTPFSAMRMRNGVLAPAYLLDLYPGAVAAYSVARKLKSTATNLIQLQRSSDSATLNLGASGIALDTAAAATFVGANHGDVTAMYNQANGLDYIGGSGNCRMYASGVLQTLGSNSRPAAVLGASSYFSTSLGGSVPSFGTTFNVDGDKAWSVFAVYKKTTATGGCLYGWGNSGVSLAATGFYDDNSFCQVAYAGGQAFNTSIPANNTPYVSSFFKAAGAINATSSAYRNGSSVAGTGHGTGTPAIAGNQPLLIGQWANYAPNKLLGSLCELIVYASDQSANRVGIEANIAAYYGIP